MILITGAGGKTGQAVLRALSRQGEKTRALLRDGSRREAVRAAGSAGAGEVATGGFTDLADLCAAMQGACSVYHICPNMHADEIDIGRLVLQAARMSGVERIVYHSVLHPQVEAMPHHWKKMRVEELIFQSGLEFTILQPCAYMQNILGYWNAIRRDGVYALPYAATAEISVVDLEDLAQAAALVLTEPGHAGATYELCWPRGAFSGRDGAPDRRGAGTSGQRQIAGSGGLGGARPRGRDDGL